MCQRSRKSSARADSVYRDSREKERADEFLICTVPRVFRGAQSILLYGCLPNQKPVLVHCSEIYRGLRRGGGDLDFLVGPDLFFVFVFFANH